MVESIQVKAQSVSDLAFGPAPEGVSSVPSSTSPTPFRHLLASQTPKRIPMDGAYTQKADDAPLPLPPQPEVIPEPIKQDVKVLTLAKPEPATDQIVKLLLETPDRILDAQIVLDRFERVYRARLAALTIQAFSEPLFPGKKPEDGMRCAGNDTEREAAIMQLTANDAQLVSAALQREGALRELHLHRNRLEGALAAARLLSSAA